MMVEKNEGRQHKARRLAQAGSGLHDQRWSGEQLASNNLPLHKNYVRGRLRSQGKSFF
jgi:hypothetical protein